MPMAEILNTEDPPPSHPLVRTAGEHSDPVAYEILANTYDLGDFETPEEHRDTNAWLDPRVRALTVCWGGVDDTAQAIA